MFLSRVFSSLLDVTTMLLVHLGDSKQPVNDRIFHLDLGLTRGRSGVARLEWARV